MPSIVSILRAAADPTRLRILLLLNEEELSVAELQEILAMGQSTISTHLSQLKRAGLVEDRRTGKSSMYRLTALPAEGGVASKGHDLGRADASKRPRSVPSTTAGRRFWDDLLANALIEIPEAGTDLAAMRRVVKKRQERMRTFFDSMAGRLGRDYVPGKTWKSLAEAFIRLLPPMVIADLGAGDGSSALLLARNAVQVLAVDSSMKMLEVGREKAMRSAMSNIDFRLGDMEELPIDDACVDLALFSQSLHHAQHPERAAREAARILRPGGKIVILDLARHRFEEAREIYADEWLGFSEAELDSMLVDAGFVEIEALIVDKDTEAPQFQTLLAVGTKGQP